MGGLSDPSTFTQLPPPALNFQGIHIMEKAFKDLHAAALTIGTKLMATLQQGEIEAVDKATKAGAVVMLQLGPLPDCQRVELLLREREGRTHTLASIGSVPC